VSCTVRPICPDLKLHRQLGDCHSLRCKGEWYPYANSTLSKYAFELPEVFAYDQVDSQFPGWEMGMFGHSPDTVSPLVDAD